MAGAGEIYITFGKNSNSTWDNIDLRPDAEGNFVTGTTGFKILGGETRGALGTSVSGIGDINGDGINDILVSAPQTSAQVLPRTLF